MADLATLETIERLMATQRAVRRFTAAPVDDALMERILAAGTRAPSARNSQPWRFIVVRIEETKRNIFEVSGL